MGRLSVPNETFWQLFVRAGARWSLRTPTDVATNGGVVAALGANAALTTGVLPSNELRFSPLERTEDLGRTWTTGVAPGPLAAAPDVLASSRGDRVFVVTRLGSVSEGGPGLSSWTTLAGVPSLRSVAANGGCPLTALTGVAVTASGQPIVAGSCTARGRGPLLMLVDGRWRLVGPTIAAGVHEVVLRLVVTPGGAVAVIEVVEGDMDVIVTATSRDHLASWHTSAPLVVTDEHVLSSTVTSGGAALVVLTGTRGARTAHVVGSSGGSWVTLRGLPAGTVDVVTGPGPMFQALSSSGATLTVHEGDGHSGWRTVQRIVVPIAYGSSS